MLNLMAANVNEDHSARGDYAMAMTMLGDLALASSESETIGRILDMFSSLYAPSALFYLPVRDGHAQEVISFPAGRVDATVVRDRLENVEGAYAWTGSGDGFVLRIGYRNETVGVVEVNGLAFPEHKERYLNVALSFVGVCGLAIENSRRFEQLTAQKNQLAATLDALPDLLFELGLDSHIYEYYSPRTDLLFLPAEDFIGKKMSELLPPEAGAVMMEALAEAHEMGHSGGKQYQLVLPVGERWFDISGARKPVGAGEPPRFIFISRDITARKEAVKSLRDRNTELTRFNRAAVGRELRMIELKKEINTLCRKLKEDEAYPLHTNSEE